LVDLETVDSWCPKCFVDGRAVGHAQGLDTYLALMQLAYAASPADVEAVRHVAERHGRVVAGSRYLGLIVPESAGMHNILGISAAAGGDIERALVEFREALRLEPDSAATHWHLGAALASVGARDEAIKHLERSVQIDPANEYARNDLRALTGGPQPP
jgi:tetratricopeptide (TPR) repeat protein